MKTTFFAVVAALIASAAPLLAINFQFRYHFLEGDYVIGDFTADFYDSDPAYLKNVQPTGMGYFSTTGELITFDPTDGPTGHYRIPSNAAAGEAITSEISLWFNRDSNGEGADVSLKIRTENNGEQTIGFIDEAKNVGNSEIFRREAWMLLPFFSVPDATATLSLLSLGLIGIAGVKRLR